MEQRWLSTADAAKWLGVSPVTVLRLMHEGAIPCSKVGRAYRINATDLEAYVDAHHPTEGRADDLRANP